MNPSPLLFCELLEFLIVFTDVQVINMREIIHPIFHFFHYCFKVAAAFLIYQTGIIQFFQLRQQFLCMQIQYRTGYHSYKRAVAALAGFQLPVVKYK